MNTAQFIPHHLFVAAAGKGTVGRSEARPAQTGANHSAEDARTIPLEVMDRSQPLPAGLLLTIAAASAGAS
jgi:hypothetical protein